MKFTAVCMTTASQMSPNGRYCCKSLFALLIKNSLGSRCDFGINMRGASSHSDELTGDFGNKPEAILIGDHSLSCLLAGKLALRDLRLLEKYRQLADNPAAPAFVRLGPEADMGAGTSAEIDLNHFAPRGSAQYVYNSVSRIARNRNPRLGLPAAYFTGDRHG